MVRGWDNEGTRELLSVVEIFFIFIVEGVTKEYTLLKLKKLYN